MPLTKHETGRVVCVFSATSQRGRAVINALLSANQKHYDQRVAAEYTAVRKRDLLAAHGLSMADAWLLPSPLPPSPNVLQRSSSRSSRFLENGFEATMPALTLAAAATTSAAAALALPGSALSAPNEEAGASLTRAMEASLSAQGERVESTPRWRIRVITRSSDSIRAAELRDLSPDIEVVEAHLCDPASLAPVLKDAFAVFLSPFYSCFPLSPRLLEAIRLPGGVLDQVADGDTQVVILDGVERPRQDALVPESMRTADAIAERLFSLVKEGKLVSATVLDNGIPMELALEGHGIVAMQHEGFFELDVVAPTSETLPFCAISDIGPLVSLILDSPTPNPKFDCKHIDLVSDVLSVRELCAQLEQNAYLSCGPVRPREYTMETCQEASEGLPEAQHELFLYWSGCSRSRRPPREPSSSRRGFALTTWADWSAANMAQILPQFATPSASKVAQSLQVAASTVARLQNAQLGTTREESMFLIPFGSSDQDLEIENMLATARANMQADGSLPGLVDDAGPRYAVKVAW